MSHGDPSISHPRDQDYLSLWVGKGSEVEMKQALAYMVANLRKREREEKQSMAEKINSDQEVILNLLTFKHNTRPCSLAGLSRKETIMATHAVDAF